MRATKTCLLAWRCWCCWPSQLVLCGHFSPCAQVSHPCTSLLLLLLDRSGCSLSGTLSLLIMNVGFLWVQWTSKIPAPSTLACSRRSAEKHLQRIWPHPNLVRVLVLQAPRCLLPLGRHLPITHSRQLAHQSLRNPHSLPPLCKWTRNQLAFCSLSQSLLRLPPASTLRRFKM